jgi:mono/diheme cytochrome c family protein
MKRNLLAVAVAGTALIGGVAGLALLTSAAQAQAQLTQQEQAGKVVFDYWCAPCHAPGPGHPGTQSLQIKYRGSEVPAVLEERQDLTPPIVETFVRNGILSMAPFRKTEITDAELADLAAYLSN